MKIFLQDAQNVTVSCALWSSGLIGSYFFENDEVQIQIFKMWFLQEGALASIRWCVAENFWGPITSQPGFFIRPPRSWDLIPSNFLKCFLRLCQQTYSTWAPKNYHWPSYNRDKPKNLWISHWKSLKRMNCCRMAAGGNLIYIINEHY